MKITRLDELKLENRFKTYRKSINQTFFYKNYSYVSNQLF